MAPRVQEYKTLLNFVGLLHKAHEGDRPRPFNLFSVLRGARDEVRLHSRFLAALLDHRDHRTKGQENLKDFLRAVLSLKDDRFDWAKSMVQKERSNIDILITLGDQVAVVIENKIDHGDEERQLERYVETVDSWGYEEIHPIYLTLDGRPPSPESIGSLSLERVTRIGYSSNAFQDWLRNCQRRAFDEPELRGSIVQYLRLVQELTGTDRKGGYMGALKELLKEGNNLCLAQDISDAIRETMIELELCLWTRVKREIGDRTGLGFTDFPNSVRTLREAVGNHYHKSQHGYGIVHDLPGYETLWLRVSREKYKGHDTIYGVSRRPGPIDQTLFERESCEIRRLLKGDLLAGRGDSTCWWPYLRLTRFPDLRKSSREEYDKEVESFTREIADGMDEIRRAIERGRAEQGLDKPPPERAAGA